MTSTLDFKHLYVEIIRQHTLSQSPTGLLNSRELAALGFYFNTDINRYVCYFCGVKIKKWNDSDIPAYVHKILSKNCPLLNDSKCTNNVPTNQKYLERLLEHGNSIISIDDAYLSLPAFPTFINSTDRFESFNFFPEEHLNDSWNIKDMVKSGLFYTGVASIVRCFYCCVSFCDHFNVILNPYEAHFMAKGSCKYFQSINPISKIRTSIVEYFNDNNKPIHSTYASIDSRLKSYYFNSMQLDFDIHKLACAGFFYFGQDYTIVCFHCGTMFLNYNNTMNPFRIHYEHVPFCSYIIQLLNQGIHCPRSDSDYIKAGVHIHSVAVTEN